MPPQTIKLAAIGDIALTHDYDRILLNKDAYYPFEKVRDILKSNDIVFGNLEAPVSLRGEIYPLKCSLRTNPDYLVALKDAGFNLLSLANNHILDYGETAFFDTLDTLTGCGIKWFGAGKNLEDARKPAVLNINDIRIGFLGYCDVVIDSPFYASKDKRGIVPLNLEYVRQDIFRLRGQVDCIAISIHWGHENWGYPSPEQIRMAHEIIDYGADVIFGHHPHVLHGIEKYRRGIIAYSLGNFIFSDILWDWTNKAGDKVACTVKMTEKNRETGILLMEVNRQGVSSHDFIPCHISKNLQPVPVKDARSRSMNIARLSERISLRWYATFWFCYVLSKKIISKATWFYRKLRGAPGFANRLLKSILRCKS